MTDLRKLLIDDVEVEVDPNLTLLQACEEADVEIPRFCYHERLSIAGNCRMCLVEVVGGPPKPAASCAMQVKDLRPGPEGAPPQIRTKSPMVKKAREGVMEFMLVNHPLDCPICDQGGECDLQDQAMAYGVDFSRFRESKRAVDDIYLGPLVKTAMTRCISCTRCVRFITEVAGAPEMGSIGRGEDAEITSYLNQALTSELQGNVIDLCPVGALTSKPYAFTARPWELKKTESIDVMDALGANIRVDVRGREVMRILPRNHDDVNEEWLSDKSRFIWDGLRRQRLDKPYVRKDGKLTPTSWGEAFSAVAARLKGVPGDRIAAIAGDLAPVEAMWALKGLMGALGSVNMDCRQDGAKLPAGNRSAYLFNATVAGLDAADAILIVGANPRLESPVLNARIRKAWLAGANVAVIGERSDLTYEYHYLGAGPEMLAGAVKSVIGERLRAAKNPVIILGMGAVARPDGAAVLGTTMELAAAVGAQFSVLHTAAARVGGLDIGFTPGAGGADVAGVLEGASSGAIDAVFLLGADEIDVNRLGEAFVVYLGSHGDRGAHRADVILPGAAYTEQSGIFVNTEGRPQMAMRAGFPPGEAREDWAILRALSQTLGCKLPYDNLAQLRAEMFAALPHLGELDKVTAVEFKPEPAGTMGPDPFVSPIKDFHLTNPIARASEVMAELSKMTAGRSKQVAAE